MIEGVERQSDFFTGAQRSLRVLVSFPSGVSVLRRAQASAGRPITQQRGSTMPKITRPTRPLADVNVLSQHDGSHEIVVCFMPDPVLLFGEGNSRAFLALDASASLRKMYGFGGPFGGDPNYMQAVARKLGTTLTSITRSGKVAALYWAVSPDGSKVEPIGEF